LGKTIISPGGETTVRAWDVFISHASEDKPAVTIPLAAALERAGLRVWLDRQEVRIGDSLREKIDEGLASSRFGVVVLSPTFLGKGWTRQELDGLFAVEEVQGRTVILPVWHQIDKAALVKYSPILADRLAANTADGIPAVAAVIIATVTDPGTGAPSDVSPTPLRLLVELLDRAPDRTEVVQFLSSYPRIMQRALPFDRGADRWTTELGPVTVDFAASKTQFTTGEVAWHLVQFGPPASRLFLGSEPAPAVQERIAGLRALRRWIADNLMPAREKFPGIMTTFQGVVVAGRRQRLSDGDVEALRECNDELPGNTVRTYDWIVDAAADEQPRA
jgi:hypothetical protein